MNPDSLNDVTRILAIPLSRRRLLQGLGGTVAGGLLAGLPLTNSHAAPPAPPTPAAALNPPRWAPIVGAFPNRLSTVRAANAVRHLIDGPETYREMVAAIRAAQTSEHYIYLLGWSLVDDFELITGDPTTTIQRLFADAAGREVQIRAMLWRQVGGANRAQVDRINRLSTGAAILDNETPNPIIAFGSHHQKVLVVKGAQGLVAFCGGLDINSDRILPVNPSLGDPQHDVHCRIVGPAAFDLLRTFLLRWDHHPDSLGIDSRRGALLGRSEPVPAPMTSPPPSSSSTGGACSVRIARTFNPVTGRGAAVCERDVQNLLVHAIRNTQRFIYLEDQYMVNRFAAVEMRRVVPRLQHITILTTASEILAGSGEFGSGGLPCVWKMRREFVADLTGGLSPADQAKVRIFVLVTPPAGAPPVFGPHTYVHAKTWVFDDELAVIGSANCNRRSWTHDSEANAFIFDDAPPQQSPGHTFAQAMRMQLWAEHLDVPASAVEDGVTSAAQWLTSTPVARVRLYDPHAATDAVPDLVCNATLNTIDPFMVCP